MTDHKRAKLANFTLIFLTVWGAIQIARLIAIPLIGDILARKEDPAWMFPAMLDVVVALASVYLLPALWKKQAFSTWLYAFLYLFLSIIDHIDGAVAAAFSTTPGLFGGPARPKSEVIISLLVPAVIDLIPLLLLCRPQVRAAFFSLEIRSQGPR